MHDIALINCHGLKKCHLLNGATLLPLSEETWATRGQYLALTKA